MKRHNARAAWLTFLVLLSSVTPAFAQSAGLRAGDEVRVSWWDGYVSSYAYQMPRTTTAEVLDVSGDALMLRRGDRVFTVRASELRSVQLRVGTKPASAPAMVIGSAAGFAAGFALGALTGGIEGGGAGVDRMDAGLTTGVLIGAPIGALVAWATSRSRGIYEDVPFSEVLSGVLSDVVVEPSGRVGLSIRTGRR